MISNLWLSVAYAAASAHVCHSDWHQHRAPKGILSCHDGHGQKPYSAASHQWCHPERPARLRFPRGPRPAKDYPKMRPCEARSFRRGPSAERLPRGLSACWEPRTGNTKEDRQTLRSEQRWNHCVRQSSSLWRTARESLPFRQKLAKMQDERECDL